MGRTSSHLAKEGTWSWERQICGSFAIQKSVTYLNPSLSMISYMIPHSLLINNTLTDNFGGRIVHIPVGFCISSSSSCIRYCGTGEACICAWNVKGQVDLGGSSGKILAKWISAHIWKELQTLRGILANDSWIDEMFQLFHAHIELRFNELSGLVFEGRWDKRWKHSNVYMTSEMCLSSACMLSKKSAYPEGSANPYIKPVWMKWTPSSSRRISSDVVASVSSILPYFFLP